jgi:hypothetical protein
MAVLEDFRLVSVSPQLQPFQPSPMDEVCLSLGTHDNRVRSCLHAHYVIGQAQDNRRIGARPNQGREPPLFWSVEFMKEVIHVESNDTAPLVFPLVAPAMGFFVSRLTILDVYDQEATAALSWWRCVRGWGTAFAGVSFSLTLPSIKERSNTCFDQHIGVCGYG